MTVRTEMDRAALNMDDARAYYLAHGAIEATMMQIADRSSRGEGDSLHAFRPGQRFLRFAFPTGEVEVEIIGESGKLNLNRASPRGVGRSAGWPAVLIRHGLLSRWGSTLSIADRAV